MYDSALKASETSADMSGQANKYSSRVVSKVLAYCVAVKSTAVQLVAASSITASSIISVSASQLSCSCTLLIFIHCCCCTTFDVAVAFLRHAPSISVAQAGLFVTSLVQPPWSAHVLP